MGKMTLILPALGYKRYNIDQKLSLISVETIPTFSLMHTANCLLH